MRKKIGVIKFPRVPPLPDKPLAPTAAPPRDENVMRWSGRRRGGGPLIFQREGEGLPGPILKSRNASDTYQKSLLDQRAREKDI